MYNLTDDPVHVQGGENGAGGRGEEAQGGGDTAYGRAAEAERGS